jgi:hypothetical protein
MITSPNRIPPWVIAAAITAVVLVLSVASGLYRNANAPAVVPSGITTTIPSYEDTVRDQQKRWGHGHTQGDAPGDAGGAR